MATTDEEPKPVHEGEVVMVEKARDGAHRDGDEAHSEGQTIPSSAGADFSDKEKSAVLRKIDWRIVPLAAWACGLQFVDKASLGAAATYGLREDLGLEDQDYSWCVSIFYLGYLAGTFLTGRALQYFHAGKVMGVCYFVWGGTLLACIGAKGFSSLMALRFLLGILESSLVPGLLLVTTMWYTQKEQPFRFGLWTSLNGFLPVPFLVIYWGLGQVKSGPLISWQLIFLLVGLLSSVTGVLMWVFIPDSPERAKWLTERERAIAMHRVAEDQLGRKNAHFDWAQLREAVTDYRAWLIVLQMFFSQAMGSVTTNFIGIIIKGFGYSQLQAQLYTAPSYAVQGFMQLIVSSLPTFSARCRSMKQPITAASSIISLIGVVILFVTPDEAQYQGRRLAAVIIISCAGVNYTVTMSVLGSNITGSTKKQLTTSTAFFLYCVVNIITPQTFLGRESPRYPTGLAFTMSFISTFIVLAMATWLSMRLENARRDKKARTNRDYARLTAGDDELDVNLQDQTDRQNKHFRYTG